MPSLVATRRALLRAPFSPLGWPTLAQWLDADDPATWFQDSALTTPATADGDPIGGLKDKSGRGRHATQATSTKRGALKLGVQNTRNAVDLDGSDDFLDASYTLAAPLTIFTVARNDGAAAASRFLQDSPSRLAISFNNGVSNQLRAESSGTPLLYTKASPTGMLLLTWVVTADGAEILERGVSQATNAVAAARSINGTHRLGASFSATPDRFLLGRFCERITVGPTSPAERAVCEAYLIAKWGL